MRRLKMKFVFVNLNSRSSFIINYHFSTTTSRKAESMQSTLFSIRSSASTTTSSQFRFGIWLGIRQTQWISLKQSTTRIWRLLDSPTTSSSTYGELSPMHGKEESSDRKDECGLNIFLYIKTYPYRNKNRFMCRN